MIEKKNAMNFLDINFFGDLFLTGAGGTAAPDVGSRRSRTYKLTNLQGHKRDKGKQGGTRIK